MFYINYLIKVINGLVNCCGFIEDMLLFVVVFYDIVEDIDVIGEELFDWFGYEVVGIVFEFIDDMSLFYELCK